MYKYKYMYILIIYIINVSSYLYFFYTNVYTCRRSSLLLQEGVVFIHPNHIPDPDHVTDEKPQVPLI
jgi:hypothetical protein